jgi:hypothetical protein
MREPLVQNPFLVPSNAGPLPNPSAYRRRQGRYGDQLLRGLNLITYAAQHPNEQQCGRVAAMRRVMFCKSIGKRFHLVPPGRCGKGEC